MDIEVRSQFEVKRKLRNLINYDTGCGLNKGCSVWLKQSPAAGCHSLSYASIAVSMAVGRTRSGPDLAGENNSFRLSPRDF